MENETYIFGIRAIEEAIAAGRSISKVLARQGLGGDLFKHLQETCRIKQIRIQFTTLEVLDRITTSNHQGVVAVMDPTQYLELDELLPAIAAEGRTPLIVVLDGITDVRNLGAIARSAHCAGVDALIVPTKGSAPINGESVKTSAGALHYIKICKTNNPYFAVKHLKNNGLQVVGATEKGADDYFRTDFKKPTVIILGSEDYVISIHLLKLCDAKAKISMYGKIESLNVSVAAGIMFFEAARQRNN